MNFRKKVAMVYHLPILRLNYDPFEDWGYIALHMSVGLSVCRSVGP